MRKIRLLPWSKCSVSAKIIRIAVLVTAFCITYANADIFIVKRNAASAASATPEIQISQAIQVITKEEEEDKLMMEAAKLAITPSESVLPTTEELLDEFKIEVVDVPVTNNSEEIFSKEEIEILAKTLYGEANCVESKAERSMVVWVILNRLDSGRFGDTITEICTRPMQFTGYKASNPINDRSLELVKDVIARWQAEKNGETSVGRTIPAVFLFFHADSSKTKGWHNAFYKYTNVVYGEKVYFDRNNPVENPYEN